MKRIVCPLVLMAVWAMSFFVLADDAVPTGTATKIWDQAPHNAFTDLVRFNDRWFCVFREGQGHVSPDGALRVITSVERLHDVGYPNETSIVFEGDTAYCLLRRDSYHDSKDLTSALLGVSQAPFTQWDWKDLGTQIGGPHMIQLPDGRTVAAVRLYDKKVRTSLCRLDLQAGKLTEYLALPSGGDTSYAGLVVHEGQLWVSYYSSHEGKTSIYLSKMPLPSPTLDIGSRRELFLDKYLIEQLDNASLKLHEPRLAPPMTEPADNLEYGTIIKDGDLFRLYTRDGRGAKFDGDAAEVTRYCESRDGIHWTKPKLGLFEIDGSKDNNVILHEAPFCHNFSPFLDQRPEVPTEQRFKALAGTVRSGLVAFVSADGIHWRKLQTEPVIPSEAPFPFIHLFDSQNVGFWSETEGRYVCYFRVWDGRRRIAGTVSSDFRSWSSPVLLECNLPGEHFYTSQTHPYFRAPHIYIATPTRYQERDASTDILFMTARGNTPYDRTFREAFIRPGLDPERWGNRSNYAALNIVPTGPAEMSIYTTPFRRFTLRTDGFASVHVGADVGEFVTRPLRFTGKELVINYSTSAGGSVRVELQNESGHPIPGFTLADSRNLVGDAIEQPVNWTKGADVSSLAGQPVRLRFVMQDADLFAIQFQQGE